MVRVMFRRILYSVLSTRYSVPRRSPAPNPYSLIPGPRSLLLTAVLWVFPLAATATLPVQGTAATPLTNAVVRIPSHGASATVIHTENGKTLLLGCGHAYQGQDRYKRMTLDIPCSAAGAARNVGIQLLAVDHEADLSLVQLNAGPVEAFAPVAPAGYVSSHHLLSVGFDNMQLPATVRDAHLLGSTGTITFTRERPWHGRSGGALLDVEAGYLVGVVSGYEVTGQRRGMYVSHQTILQFLAHQRGSVPDSGRNQLTPAASEHPGIGLPLSTPFFCPPRG